MYRRKMASKHLGHQAKERLRRKQEQGMGDSREQVKEKERKEEMIN